MHQYDFFLEHVYLCLSASRRFCSEVEFKCQATCDGVFYQSAQNQGPICKTFALQKYI